MYALANKESLPIGFWGGGSIPAGGPTSSGTHWVLLLQNTLAGQYGTDWASAFATGANVNKIREVFICPDAPGEFSMNAGVSGLTSYLSHPRLIPFMSTGWPLDGANGNQPFKPYKISRIRRSSDIAMIFDGSLQPSGTDGNVYGPANDVPVAIVLDQYGFVNGPTNATYMTDQYPAGAPSWNAPSGSVNFNANPGPSPQFNNTDSTQNPQNIRFRHNKDKIANALQADGSVQSYQFRDGTNSDFKRGNINVNP
jgi:prepilin-type processing-associated H-X9-DG protein